MPQKCNSTIRIKYSHPAFGLPLLRHYQAVCVGRTIWFKASPEAISPRLLRHELTHQAQMDRHGRLVFYAIYLRDYVRNLWRFRQHDRAYSEIPFEIEAREGERDEQILGAMANRLP